MKKGAAHGWRIVGISFLLSVILSAAVIFIANDVFAFVSDTGEKTVTIPENATAEDVSSILKQNGLIRFPFIYRLYALMRSWNGEYLSGEFVLNDAMSYDELRYALSAHRGARSQIKVTIPEGYTTDEIIALFVSLGIGTPEGFADVIENGGSFGYDFIAEIPEDTGRSYRLDGYLFPDTYFFYQDDSEVQVINKLLNNFENKFDDIYYERCERLGMTFDEVITLASMIQAEAKLAVDFEYISSVFHNRLNSDSFPFLESDATVQYCLENRNEDLTQEDLDIDNPYNTYVYEGLPPGPICNPGTEAIYAALYPYETSYYYFYTKKNGETVYSRTYQEHQNHINADKNS